MSRCRVTGETVDLSQASNAAERESDEKDGGVSRKEDDCV